MAEKKIANRKRLDFSKIPATITIPNLIEVQKRSYERFLQMDKLHSERDDAGLQSVFQSVFPIADFRNVSQLEFVDYAIGNWEWKCGHLKGLNHLRTTCKNCGSWVEFEYDQKNVLYVRIDRKRKFLGTIFLRALGLRTDEEILRTFYTVDRVALRDKRLFWTVAPAERATNLLGMKLTHS